MINDSYTKFNKILRQYGRTVSIEKDQKLYAAQAYIEPLTHQNRQYLDEKYSEIGYREQNMFRYIGSADGGGALLAVGDIVRDGSDMFVVSVTEQLKIGSKIFYIWALLRRAKEDWV
ncbi:MAG: hypothetical protein RR787_06095 [Hydrogenoanaerobacterium sp.]